MRLTLLAGLLATFVAGCSSNPSVPIEERRFEAELYREAFIEFRSRCWKQSGRVFVDAKHLPPRNGIPRPGDKYYCI